mgnify:FL=1
MRVATVVVDARIMWIDANRLVVRIDRSLMLREIRVRDATVHVGRAVGRIELDRSIVIEQRQVAILQRIVRQSASSVVPRVQRIQPQGLRIYTDRLAMLLESLMTQPLLCQSHAY